MQSIAPGPRVFLGPFFGNEDGGNEMKHLGIGTQLISGKVIEISATAVTVKDGKKVRKIPHMQAIAQAAAVKEKKNASVGS